MTQMSPYLSEEFRSSKRILAGSRCSPLSCTGGTHKLEKPRRFKALPLQKPWAISNVLDYDGSHGDFLVKIRKAPFQKSQSSNFFQICFKIQNL